MAFPIPGAGPGGPNPLAAILGGGGAPPGAGPQDASGASDDKGVADLLEQARQLLMQAMAKEKDPQERALISKLVDGAHQLQAQEAKEADAAMGVSPAQKMIRRAVNRGAIPGGGGGGGAY